MFESRTPGLSAPEIADLLARHEVLGADQPDLRTIQRWVEQAKGAGPGWTLGSVGFGGSSAAIVLRALGKLAWASGSRRVTISHEEAKWTVRIARAAPTIDPFDAFQIGKLYSDRIAHGRETRSLDVYLGAAPWDGDATYLNIIENDGVGEWFHWGWRPPLELALGQYYGLPIEEQMHRHRPPLTAAEEALRAESPGWFAGSSPPSERG